MQLRTRFTGNWGLGLVWREFGAGLGTVDDGVWWVRWVLKWRLKGSEGVFIGF